MTEDRLVVERVDATRLHDLRRRVLRANDPTKVVSDPRDPASTSWHYAGLIDGRVVVCASFYPSTSPVDADAVTYQLRYMATDADHQGHGHATQVLARAERDLRAIGVEQVWANGRDTALGFYRATGWRLVEGSEHLSPETGLPHTVIVRDIGPAREM